MAATCRVIWLCRPRETAAIVIERASVILPAPAWLRRLTVKNARLRWRVMAPTLIGPTASRAQALRCFSRGSTAPGGAAHGPPAGAINTVVGSGTLITFPVLLACGYRRVLSYVHGCTLLGRLVTPAVDEKQAAAGRATQAERRARSRSALLEAAARGLSRYGYGNLILEDVARQAGYTRGALYHQFKDKDDLVLAVIDWVEKEWWREVGDLSDGQAPLEGLLAMARGHALFCRRDVARVMMALRVEFGGQDHPVAQRLDQVEERLVGHCARLIGAGRRQRSIPPGPPAKTVAQAFVGAMEGVVIAVAGKPPHDEVLAERTAAGVLGVSWRPT